MTRGLYSGRTAKEVRSLRTLRTSDGRTRRRRGSLGIDTSSIVRRLVQDGSGLHDGTPSPTPLRPFRFEPPLTASEPANVDRYSPEPQPSTSVVQREIPSVATDEDSDSVEDLESAEQVYIAIEPTEHTGPAARDALEFIHESMDTVDACNTLQMPVPDSLEGDECSTGRIHLPHHARSILQWQSVFALLVTCGTVRMTVLQYETLRSVMNWQATELSSRAPGMPGIRKVQRIIMPYVRDNAYPMSRVEHFPIALEKAGARAPSSMHSRMARTGGPLDKCTLEQAGSRSALAPVRIVPPSEWARLDISSGPLFTSMFVRDKDEQNIAFASIEDVPIVRDRHRFLSLERGIFVQKLTGGASNSSHLPQQAVTGDPVIVHFNADKVMYSAMQRDGIVEGPHKDNYAVYTLAVVIGYVWDASFADDGVTCTDVSSVFGSLEEMIAVPSFSKSSLFRNGDTVVELVLDTCHTPGPPMYLLVFRFWRDESEPRVLLVRVPATSFGKGSFRKKECCSSRVVRVQGMMNEPSRPPEGRSVPSSGYLMDGRRYLTYRALLYCDDFQPHTSKRGSFGGCYMLPLGLAPEERAGYGAVRVLGLTPPGVSSNEVLRAAIPDIVQCTTAGITDIDANGNEVTIFIDIVGYIGDYPAVTHTLDVLGHTSRAPCHLCSFLRNDRSGSKAARYAFTTTVHSRNSSFNRSRGRIESVRKACADTEQLKVLGLKPTAEQRDLPLHELSVALAAVRKDVPLTASGHPVVPSLFDPYQSSMVAPDHLLCGMAQDVLNAILVVCPPDVRRHAEILILDALRSYNMIRQNRIFSASPPALLTMGMSERFAVLLVAPTAFECARNASASSAFRSKAPSSTSSPSNPHPVLDLLRKFQALVSETHFWPELQVDGTAALQEFNKNNGQDRLDALFQYACEYVNDMHAIFSRPQAGYEEARKCLDKPNVHRFVELYAHTLPALGHTRHFQELLFETAHQPLKRGILRSNHRDPQLAAMMAVVANDWESRLSIEVESAGPPSKWSYETCRRLQRLLVGRDLASAVDMDAVIRTFSPPVLSELSKVQRGVSSSRHGRTSRVVWRLAYGPKAPHRIMCGIDEGDMDRLLRCFDLFISSARGASTCTRTSRIFPVASSTYAVSGDLESTIRVHRRGTLYPGSVLQALTIPGGTFRDGEASLRILREASETERATGAEYTCSPAFVVSFWLILALVAMEDHSSVPSAAQLGNICDSDPYAIVLPCVQASKEKQRTNLVKVAVDDTPCLLPLGSSIREVMAMHACTGPECTVDTITEYVEHSAELCSGTAFYVYGRRQGYPPRTG